LAASACATATSTTWTPPASQDTRDEPGTLRPGYGNAALGTWWPLTAPEVAALKDLDRARLGDPHALLALAILASGDRRDAASYAAFQERVDRFIADLRPAIAGAADDWHRGYELNRAMHRAFFNGEATDLAGYDFNQARVTGIFATGRYNCLSSAMLFAVLARGFGLPVRAVVVPTHVFIEIGASGGKVIEVETTSATGFDWVHDERFYKLEAAGWSGRRGLRPVTLEEYRHRSIVEPYRLMAIGLSNTHEGESDEDRARANELAALVDPDDPEALKNRIQSYDNEAVALFKSKAWRTMSRLFDSVAPALADAAARSRDPKTLELVSWANWNRANALMIVGRAGEAVALADAGLDRLDPGWQDASKLKANYLNVLDDRLGELLAKEDYPAALEVVSKHKDACRADKICAGNIGIVYGNWSVHHQNAGDWQSARQVLQQCVAELPAESRCREALTDLESRHRF
jgi:tetratricopeptide (TPR) repeat protein